MDPIGNFLTSIRNAYLARRSETVVPMSRLVARIARVLKTEGYLADVHEETTETGRRILRLTLRYQGQEPAIARIRRVSSPGQRIYAPIDQLTRPKIGFGMFILSTSAGILTDRQARQKRLGGEVLAEVITGASR